MPLTDKQLLLIEEGIRLAVAAVLAAVRVAGDANQDEPLDWSRLRITETPEMALEDATEARRTEDEKNQIRNPKS